MKRFRIPRRTVLRGLGGVAIALPWLDVMEPSAQAQTTTPRRFVVMYEQSGVVLPAWLPSGSGTAFTLSPTLEPLAPYQSRILVVDGLSNDAAKSGPGDDHSKGMGTMLTGRNLQGDENNLSASGISLDQEIANHIGQDTQFKSLEFGVDSGQGHVTNYMSFSGAGSPLPANSDPSDMYGRIFRNFTAPESTDAGPDPDAVQRLAEEQSVLDAAADSYEALLPRVSQEDRAKLQAHLDNIRDLERRLTALPESAGGVSASCENPGDPSLGRGASFPDVGRAQMDLLVMALACDLSRVCCMQFSRESADPIFSWLGINQGHHLISHEDYDTNGTVYEQLAAIDRWHAEQFFYLIDRLANLQEGDGTVLDNTVLLWVNGLTRGNWHNHDNQPIVLAGGENLGLATGQLAKYDSRTTNDLYVNVLNAFGVQTSTFGDQNFVSGPLDGILA